MSAEERLRRTTGGVRYSVALAGTWECGTCGEQGDGEVEEGEVFEVDHECDTE